MDRSSNFGLLLRQSDSTGDTEPMTPEQFVKWLAEMKAAGIARSDAECARLLGMTANSIVTMKKQGTDLRTALACRALIHRLGPYGS